MSDIFRLPSTGLLRLSAFLGPGKLIPISKSTWWAGVASGRYPQPVRLGLRAVAWRTEDLKSLIEHGICDVASGPADDGGAA